MNTILNIKTFILTFIYQIPGVPGGGGDTNIDAASAPIDDYLILGLIAGVLMIVVFAVMQKNKTTRLTK